MTASKNTPTDVQLPGLYSSGFTYSNKEKLKASLLLNLALGKSYAHSEFMLATGMSSVFSSVDLSLEKVDESYPGEISLKVEATNFAGSEGLDLATPLSDYAYQQDLERLSKRPAYKSPHKVGTEILLENLRGFLKTAREYQDKGYSANDFLGIFLTESKELRAVMSFLNHLVESSDYQKKLSSKLAEAAQEEVSETKRPYLPFVLNNLSFVLPDTESFSAYSGKTILDVVLAASKDLLGVDTTTVAIRVAGICTWAISMVGGDYKAEFIEVESPKFPGKHTETDTYKPLLGDTADRSDSKSTLGKTSYRGGDWRFIYKLAMEARNLEKVRKERQSRSVKETRLGSLDAFFALFPENSTGPENSTQTATIGNSEQGSGKAPHEDEGKFFKKSPE